MSNRTFRKYHRLLALIFLLPITLTVITGMLVSIVQDWSIYTGLSSNFLLKLHTGEIFKLQAVYPFLNGLGLIGLLITGSTMLGIGKKNRRRSRSN